MSKTVEFSNRDRFIELGLTIAAPKNERNVPGTVSGKSEDQPFSFELY